MRKVLLGTTALVSLAAGAAMADPLHVMVGGTIESQFGVVDQADGYDITGGTVTAGLPTFTNLFPGNDNGDAVRTHKTNMSNKSDVYVAVSHKADNGMVYGGYAGLMTNAMYDDKYAPKAKRTYLFAENKYGRFEFGSNYSVDATMKVDASSIARATGGVNGQWFWFANVTTAMTTSTLDTVFSGTVTTNPMTNLAKVPTNTQHYFVSPNFVHTAASEVKKEDARKVSYYTPRYMGFQGGVSFTPDAGQFGNTSKALSNAGAASCCEGYVPTVRGTITDEAENVVTLAANYKGKLENLDVKASVMANLGHSERAYYRHLREYQFGASMHFAGFHIAGSYQDTGKSLTAKSATVNGAHIWTIGGAYTNGPVGASVTYLTSNVNKNKFHNLSVGADYQLARGLMPYVEVTFFDFKPSAANKATASSVDGTVFILGSELTF